MVDIEQLKKDGAIRLIKNKISALKWDISSGEVWNNTVKNDRFYRLHNTIIKTKNLLNEMDELLTELIKLQSGNS